MVVSMANSAGQSIRSIGCRFTIKLQQIAHHSLYLFFGCVALANNRFFDLQRCVFVHGQGPKGQRAQCSPTCLPQEQGSVGFTLTNTFSIADSVGWCVLMSSWRAEKIVFRRWANSRSVGTTIVPLATYCRWLPCTSMTPYPVRRKPGSIPMMRISDGSDGSG